MKKLILICLFVLLALPLSAQVQSSVSRFNSTAQELDSAGVYTGTAEVVTGFTSISVTIRADSSGSYLVLFGNGSTLTNATAYKIYSMNYIAGDTAHTRTFPVVAPYFKIIYTTTATDTSNLYIVTMLHRDGVAPQTTIVLPYMTASLEKISPITYPKIYIKQRDGLGTMNYDIIWIGR